MATSASAPATPPARRQGLWRRRDLSAALAASAMPGAGWAIPAAVSASALQADLAIPQRACTALHPACTATTVAELLPLGRADGHNLEKQRSTLEVQGRGRYEAFDVFYPMLFPFNGDRFRLALRSAEGGDAQQAIDVAAVRFSVRAAAADEPHSIKSAPDAPAFTLQWPPADVALLRMPNWALYNSRWNWQVFIDDSFVQMADRGTPPPGHRSSRQRRRLERGRAAARASHRS
jgi:hypothetical protein